MLLVDARGAPLSIIVTGANPHDVTQLATTLDSITRRAPRAQGVSAAEFVRGRGL